LTSKKEAGFVESLPLAVGLVTVFTDFSAKGFGGAFLDLVVALGVVFGVGLSPGLIAGYGSERGALVGLDLRRAALGILIDLFVLLMN